jgi:hypothetical protein
LSLEGIADICHPVVREKQLRKGPTRHALPHARATPAAPSIKDDAMFDHAAFRRAITVTAR